MKTEKKFYNLTAHVVTCESCGYSGLTDEFWIYKGNSGECKSCLSFRRSKEPEKTIIDVNFLKRLYRKG